MGGDCDRRSTPTVVHAVLLGHDNSFLPAADDAVSSCRLDNGSSSPTASKVRTAWALGLSLDARN